MNTRSEPRARLEPGATDCCICAHTVRHRVQTRLPGRTEYCVVVICCQRVSSRSTSELSSASPCRRYLEAVETMNRITRKKMTVLQGNHARLLSTNSAAAAAAIRCFGRRGSGSRRASVAQ